MDQEKYKKILLDKFFQKNLSKDERHELEKLALDDPFLFEAMQGFTEVEGDHHTDLKRIKSKKLGVKEKKKRSLIPYGIAASLLVLVSLSVWTLNTKSNLFADQTFAEAKGSRPMNTKAKAVESTPRVAEMEEEVSIEEIGEESEIYSDQVEVENISKAKKAVQIPAADQIAENVKDTYEHKESNYDMNQAASVPAPTGPPSGPTGRNKSSRISNGNSAPMMQGDVLKEEVVAEDVEVLDESVVSSKSNIQNKNKAMQESVRSAMDVVTIDGVELKNNFDSYFISSLREKFNAKEVRNLSKELVIEFDVVNSAVANFKTTPNQNPETNVRLLELVKQGIQFLPNNLQGYKLDLTSL